jgi:hypothetical protein
MSGIRRAQISIAAAAFCAVWGRMKKFSKICPATLHTTAASSTIRISRIGPLLRDDGFR